MTVRCRAGAIPLGSLHGAGLAKVRVRARDRARVRARARVTRFRVRARASARGAAWQVAGPSVSLSASKRVRISGRVQMVRSTWLGLGLG